jgi:hypothetical protein
LVKHPKVLNLTGKFEMRQCRRQALDCSIKVGEQIRKDHRARRKQRQQSLMVIRDNLHQQARLV